MRVEKGGPILTHAALGVVRLGLERLLLALDKTGLCDDGSSLGVRLSLLSTCTQQEKNRHHRAGPSNAQNRPQPRSLCHSAAVVACKPRITNAWAPLPRENEIAGKEWEGVSHGVEHDDDESSSYHVHHRLGPEDEPVHGDHPPSIFPRVLPRVMTSHPRSR
jgi:hypothetical protein